MKEGMIALTFDDGFLTDLTVGLQEQLNRGMTPKGTSYVITSYGSEVRLQPEDEIELVNHGWDLQCHTHTHPIGPGLEGQTAEFLHNEMQEVNRYFNDVLGLPAPEHHAYPGGGTNKLVRDVLRRYRKTMRGTESLVISNKPDWERLPTYPLGNPETLAGAKRVIDFCDKYGLAATFYTHELDTQDRIDTYCAVLDYCLEKNIRLVTISEMYEELTRI